MWRPSRRQCTAKAGASTRGVSGAGNCCTRKLGRGGLERVGLTTLRALPCCSFSSRTCVQSPLSFQYPAEQVVHATSLLPKQVDPDVAQEGCVVHCVARHASGRVSLARGDSPLPTHAHNSRRQTHRGAHPVLSVGTGDRLVRQPRAGGSALQGQR